MEPTLTQNCALYYAQHKLQHGGPRFSKDFAVRPAGKRRRQPQGERFRRLALYQDNGR